MEPHLLEDFCHRLGILKASIAQWSFKVADIAIVPTRFGMSYNQ
jgi:hypothetical protein